MADRDDRSRARGDDPTDPDAGIWRGRSVARRFVSPDGLVILVGRTAADNDLLTFKLAAPRDFWLHVATDSGSHVVVRNPDDLRRLPRETQRLAAGLAVGHSRARAGGRTAVHLARRADVSKPRGFAPGKVLLARWESVQAAPLRDLGVESGAREAVVSSSDAPTATRSTPERSRRPGR